MAKLLNDAEMVVAVREGKRVRNHLNQVEVEIRADIVIWGDDKTPLWMYADGGPGRWELVEPETPKTVEYWDAEIKPDTARRPVFHRLGQPWFLDRVNRWGDFRGFVWELESGRKLVSALPVLQNPKDPKGHQAYPTYDESEASAQWPLAKLVAVRFQGRRPE